MPLLLPLEWTSYADIVFQRAALVTRLARDRMPDPIAGLQVSDGDVDTLLRELPGLHQVGPALDERVDEELRAALAEAATTLMSSAMGPGVLGALVASCGLTYSEVRLLALLLAVEADPRRQRLVGYLNDDVTKQFVTPHTLGLLATGDDELRDLLLAAAPGSGLRRACLLNDGNEAAWGSRSLRLHRDVLWWLSGDRALSTELPSGTRLLPLEGGGEHVLVVAAGTDRVRRTQAAVGALAADGFLLTPIPTNPVEWDAVVRQASISGLGVIVEVGDVFALEARDRIDRAIHCAWAICSATELPLASLPLRPWTHAPVSPAKATDDEIEALLAGEVQAGAAITADQLEAIAVAARAMNGDVSSAVRRLAAGGIDQLAERVVPSRGWDDLILPDAQRELIREIVARATYRDRVYGDWNFDGGSTGVLAMFAGPSGTGKTLAAEVVAAELGVDLYRVDLSRVVDKYVGETEKKLANVFEAAEASPIVLFFDEADSLLGKRTEVSSAHDRHANIEVAYLLQRLERHDGVVVLATNFASNIDSAFLRRIHVSVHFPLPEAVERRRIWERCIPAAVRSTEIDWDALAEKLEFSGGQIRNVAVRAAFLAAENDAALTMEYLIIATHREMQKAGRFFSAADLA
jgi:ATP-dependent 26S proteasome regulatory subunit